MNLKFVVFVHSTMTRAVETANLIAKELDFSEDNMVTIKQTDLLREGHPIVPVPYYGTIWKCCGNCVVTLNHLTH